MHKTFESYIQNSLDTLLQEMYNLGLKCYCFYCFNNIVDSMTEQKSQKYYM